MKWLACVVLCVLLTGCAITLNDQGKAGLYYSSTVEFGVLHKSQATDGHSKSTWDYQPLVDYIVQLKQDEKSLEKPISPKGDG